MVYNIYKVLKIIPVACLPDDAYRTRPHQESVQPPELIELMPKDKLIFHP